MKPLPCDMSREDDSTYATIYLAWRADLDRKKRERAKHTASRVDAVFQRDPLQKESMMCDVLIDHFTKGIYLQAFRIEDGKIYIR